MRKKWKNVAACIVAFTMVFGNNVLIVRAEGDETEEISSEVVQDTMPAEGDASDTEDGTDEVKITEQEGEEESERKSMEEPEPEDIEKTEEPEQNPAVSDENQPMQPDSVPENNEAIEEKSIAPMADDEDSPYWIEADSDCAWEDWEEMYCGQKQTLTVQLFDWRQKEELTVQGATFEWSLQEEPEDPDEPVVKPGDIIEIAPNANKCTITAKAEGTARIRVVAKQGGNERSARTIYINVSKNTTSYVFNIEEIYAHPGDVLSVNDFSPKLVKYENGRLIGTIAPKKLVFVVEPDDSEFASRFTYNSNGTLTVKAEPDLKDIYEIFYSVGMEAYVSDEPGLCYTAWNGASVHYAAGKWKTKKKATVYNPKTQTLRCTICGRNESRQTGSRLVPQIKPNATAVTLKVKQSTKKFRVTLAAGDSVKSWKSSNKKIAAVSGKANGTCTIKAGKKTGAAKITIKTAAGAVKTIKVKVQKGKVTTSSIKQVPKKITVRRGRTYKLAPSIQPITSTDKIKYSSANKKIATVSGKGVIKGKKAGKTKITVKSGKKKVSCTVVVKK